MRYGTFWEKDIPENNDELFKESFHMVGGRERGDLLVFGGPTMCFAEELAKCHSSGKADRYSLGTISGLLGMVLTATTRTIMQSF